MKRKSIAALSIIMALLFVLAFCVITKEDKKDSGPGIEVTWPTNSSLAHASTVHLTPLQEKISYNPDGVFEAVFTNTIGLPITLRNASISEAEGSVQCESSIKTANGGITVPPGHVFSLSGKCGPKEPGQRYANTITFFYDMLPSPSGIVEEGYIGGLVAEKTEEKNDN
jgi:hypothetical protein